MLLVTNLVVFEVAWFSSVFGGANQMPWLGPLTVLFALALHFRAARKPFEELLLILICAVIGATFDSFLVAAGWVTFTSGLVSDYFTPYWIVTMWMLFATTLNVSMRWLRGKTKLAAALTALAIGWAAMMPMLMWLAENLDGMPGRRRNWIAEKA